MATESKANLKEIMICDILKCDDALELLKAAVYIPPQCMRPENYMHTGSCAQGKGSQMLTGPCENCNALKKEGIVS